MAGAGWGGGERGGEVRERGGGWGKVPPKVARKVVWMVLSGGVSRPLRKMPSRASRTAKDGRFPQE